MVKQAYSSGTPAIGVGTGNVITMVDGTTNMDDVADLIIRSKSFDHATSCSTENNIIVFESCYDDFVAAMAKKGGVLVKENTPEKEKMLKTLWPESPANHNLNRHIIAQPATKIAEMAGISVPADTKMILVEENEGYGNDFPFTGEKLSPVSGVRKCKDFEEGLDMMNKILDYQGKGHSCGIHTTMPERITKMAEVIPVCKVAVNCPQCLTNSGSWTSGFPMSMTLGCGTWGNNSISHNATWKDLLNYTYVSRPIPSYQPTDEQLFDAKIVAKVNS
jgi:sulfoacetaldehyde dehydrogenase